MKNFIISLLLLATVGCREDIYSGLTYESPDFKDSVSVKATVLNDTLYMRLGTDIASYKNYLILLTPLDDYMFQLFDKTTGQWIKNFGELGRDPEQILKVFQFHVQENEGILTAFEQGTREIYVFYLDSVIGNKKHCMDRISLKKYDKMTFRYVYKCKDGFLLDGGKCAVYPEGARFFLVSGQGELTASYDQYPFNSRPEADSVNKSRDWEILGLQKTLSPDGSKFAETTVIGGVLQTFRIGNTIEPQITKEFYKPHFAKDKNNVVYTSNTRLWTRHINSSNRHIYALTYRGHFLQAPISSPDIQVFDWQGNPVKKYKTDKDISCICVDEERGQAYFLSRTRGGAQTLCSFNL